MRKLILALAMTTAATPAFAVSIYNGDFTLGNVGFTSGYGYVGSTGPTALWPEGAYSVGTSAQNYHMYWADYADNTANAVGPRNYMIVNGDTTDGTTVWQTDALHPVTLTAGKYRFSFALSDACCTTAVYGGHDPAPPALLVNINGQQTFMNTAFMLPPGTDAGRWNTVFAEFTISPSQAPLTASFGIVNRQTAYGGNDFGLDDISISAIPETSSWALMIAGFGMVGGTMRRRTRAAVRFT